MHILFFQTPDKYSGANNMEPKERNSFTDLPSPLDDLVNEGARCCYQLIIRL